MMMTAYGSDHLNLATVLASLCLLCACGVTAADGDVTETFDVRPGGVTHEYTRQAFGLTFSFVYTAQGGTNEEWTAQIEPESGGQNRIRFTIGRPSGTSYLFFQDFRLKVEGAKIVEGNAMSQSTDTLGASEYKIGKNFLSSVDGSFESHLASAYIVVVKGKDDL